MSDNIETQQSLSDALDKTLLARVLGGEATAAELNVARQRLKDLGIGKLILPGSDIDRLCQELGKVPAPVIAPIDDAPDEAIDGRQE